MRLRLANFLAPWSDLVFVLRIAKQYFNYFVYKKLSFTERQIVFCLVFMKYFDDFGILIVCSLDIWNY